MKRIFCLLFSFILLSFMTACSQSSKDTESRNHISSNLESNSTSSIATNTDSETDHITDTDTEGKEPESSASDSAEIEPTAGNPAENTSPTITPTQPAKSPAGTGKGSDTEQQAVKPPVQTEPPTPEAKPSTPQETISEPKPETKPSPTQETKPEPVPEPPATEEESTALNIEIIVGDKIFTATLYDNAAAEALKEQLPMTLHMSELNGNEKYYYLSDSLPTDASKPSVIHTGDLMLYGNNCLVLFYESFSTSYSYTPLGYIDDPIGLAAALGAENVQVTFR